nr:MAG TPA: hypothetical protein [Bacteriophage sp.]
MTALYKNQNPESSELSGFFIPSIRKKESLWMQVF